MFKILSKKIFSQNLGQKTMFFHPKNTKNMCAISKKGKRHNILTNLRLKFQAKTSSSYGETALTRFSHNLGQKTMFFQPKNT